MTVLEMNETPVAQQARGQWLREQPVVPQITRTVYFRAWVAAGKPAFKGRLIVQQLSAENWRYGPEEDCKRDWDAAQP